MKPPLFTPFILLFLAGPAFADRVFYDGLEYADVTIIGYKKDAMVATLKSGDKRFDLAKVKWISLDATPRFLEAEQARVTDPKKSAALYLETIHSLNDPDQKLLAELRAVAPTDADGRYFEAIGYFLDVYSVNPTDATWKLHPSHIPASGSTMLVAAAERIQSRLDRFQSEEAKHNLRTLQLELYTKAGDPRADALVKELTTGIVESNTPKPDAPVTEASIIEPLQTAIRAKDYAGAISHADLILPTASEETAIRVYELKALAYQEENKLDIAASTLLRISTYYPASTSAPTALLMAADLQKSLNHVPEANRLYHEITDKYPTSPEAIKAAGK